MGQYKVAIEHRSRRRWAAFGFLLIVALLTISWFVAPTVISVTKSTFKQLGQALATIPPLHQQIAYTVIIFLILALASALIVTLAVPKKTLDVSEKELLKERDATEEYKRMARKRQRTLNRQMREHAEKTQQK